MTGSVRSMCWIQSVKNRSVYVESESVHNSIKGSGFLMLQKLLGTTAATALRFQRLLDIEISLAGQMQYLQVYNKLVVDVDCKLADAASLKQQLYVSLAAATAEQFAVRANMFWKLVVSSLHRCSSPVLLSRLP